MGKALIDQKPAGIKGGQEIDPEVFTDPQTGKSYLYWGNSYMAVAELNEDMVSINQESLRVITPTDKTFREGTTVFFRKGLYYFQWSEDDTRSENYRVRYGTATSPLGPINIPANNLVIAKDPSTGIYGTGHNAVLQIPGKDEWYIVYHRFNYPNGIAMGRAAGYNREVCIDKMEFNSDGSIKQVVPTHEGVKALKK
jgi:GH43 family beta-xylosidase